MAGGGPADPTPTEGELDLMDMELGQLDAAEIEMLVAGPADDQYNDLLDREVLAHLGLSAQGSLRAAAAAAGGSGAAPMSAPDLLSMLSGLGGLEGLVGAAGLAVAGGGAGEGMEDGTGGGAGAGAGRGSAPSVADQVANLLAGSHPSARGADLAEWLSAAEPVVSLEEGLAEVAAAGPSVGSPPQQQPTCGLLPAGMFALPPAASPAALGSAAIAAGAVPAPLPPAGAPLSIQQQLALRRQLEEQQATVAQLAEQVSFDFGTGLQQLQQPGFAMPAAWQQVQQTAAMQAGGAQLFAAGAPLDSPGCASSIGGSTSAGGPLQGLPIVGGDAAATPAYSSAVFAPNPGQPEASMFEAQPAFSSDHSADYAAAAGSGSGDYSGAVAAAATGASGGAKPSNKKFTNRQQTRISAIETELQRLQREMAAIKLENERLKAKNQEVEQQLRTQEQLQQLAAAVGSATATAGGSGRPMGAAGLRGPPLVNAVATSPPNSQRKLLMHLTVSARPADAEMLKVSALTWPKLVDWYRAQYARFREALAAAPPGGGSEAEHLAKEAMRVGRYWDLLALICRPDLCVRMLNEDMSAPPTATPPAGGRPPASQAKWPQAALAAAALPAAQRASLAGAWRQHCEAAAQRAQQRQELLAQIREGFLQPLQVAKPEEMELGKPLARRGLEAMESLRLLVRQDHVSTVQVACGIRKLLSPSQWARLVVAAWPFYPDPSKWAPLLVAEANAAKGS